MGIAIKKAQEFNVGEAFTALALLDIEVDRVTKMRDDVKTEIAQHSCPYKVGQTIFTNEGLGKNGLVVTEITFPASFGKDNCWALKTLAKTKAGVTSARMVGLSQLEKDTITKVEG